MIKYLVGGYLLLFVTLLVIYKYLHALGNTFVLVDNTMMYVYLTLGILLYKIKYLPKENSISDEKYTIITHDFKTIHRLLTNTRHIHYPRVYMNNTYTLEYTLIIQ